MHASSVSVEGRALLILGPSGSGKSTFALEMMALGAGLIADDRTQVELREGQVIAMCPPAIKGRIEAWGIGIMAAVPSPATPVFVGLDLGQIETERFPPRRYVSILGYDIPVLHKPPNGAVPAAMIQYLKGGLIE